MTTTQLHATRTDGPPHGRTARAPAIGLCGSCDAHAHCVLRSGAGRLVWECSEYAEGPPTVRATTRTLGSARTGAEDGARGLCVNCDLLRGCTLRAPGQTVLRCEEYR